MIVVARVWRRFCVCAAVFPLALATPAWANVALPSVFSSHMVLQRDKPLPVWGWADAGEKVSVTIGDQRQTTVADQQGSWQVRLLPMQVGPPRTLVVEGNNRVELNDVLVGEVWVCSGQSNMEWPLRASWDADLEIPAAQRPNIRLLRVKTAGVQFPLEDFPGQWQVCSPETAAGFSAVGFYFGRQLQDLIDVPIGLIDNSWGGSAAEAWIRRDLLDDHDLYGPLLERWTMVESQPEAKGAYQQYEAALKEWVQRVIAAKKAGQPLPPEPKRPRGNLVGNHRPGNLYNGRLRPILPLAIRGVIWYQGESNASRAYQYRDLFPRMIANWRSDWQQGELPFYWVQLADFREEKSEPAESDWAELREAQTMTLDVLPATGQAVIIDLGEAADIHPRKKLQVGRRLARLALANDYGQTIACESPRYQDLEIIDGKAAVTFATFGSRLRTVDQRELLGFDIAGEDQKWFRAKAKIVGQDRVEVWSEQVPEPVAVRYAWADNPVCNLYNVEGLPATPFRTDDWKRVTQDNR